MVICYSSNMKLIPREEEKIEESQGIGASLCYLGARNRAYDSDSWVQICPGTQRWPSVNPGSLDALLLMGPALRS